MSEKRMQASQPRSPRGGWLAAAMGLLLIAGAILSIGGAPNVTASTKASVAASAPADLSTVANADRDVLDLQLD